MKKTILTAVAVAMLGTGMTAQTGNLGLKATKQQLKSDVVKPNPNRCSSPVPSRQWDEDFNKMVEQHKKDMETARANNPNSVTATTYTIPIIFHIIHEGEAVGSGHNISQAQINSQITILNADYGGTGFNTSMYSAMTNTATGKPAFYEYAVNATGTNSVSPSSLASNGSIAIANTGVTFCLATKDPSGNTLAEPGIERKIYSTYTTTKPSQSSNIQTLFDGTIKPASIWDPTKYFNVWVSDGGTSGLLGYATFPPVSGSNGTGISSSQNGGASGNWGESNSGTPTSTDGVWVAYNAVGNTGTAAAPYQYGRSLTHESGHWLGLRHIWGDGTCANDFCNDTPPAAAANINVTSFPNPKYPFHVGTCTSAPSNSPDGEMYMNFMDYSGDAELWMFTTDQANRMHAALASSPLRSGLTASAANLCNVTVSTPTAAFTPPSNICAGVATGFADASGGPPTSWNWSVSPTAGVTITTATVASPTITFANPGTYTVTDAVANSSGNSSVSHTVTVTSCTTSACDTLSNVAPGDTITIYNITNGFLSGSGSVTSGTVTYTNKIIGEVYNKTSFPTNITQVKGAMLVIYRDAAANQGTKGTANLTVKMTNTGTDGGGAMVPGTTTSATQTVSLTSIVAAPDVAGVDYMGNNVYNYTGYMKAIPVMFPSAITMPATFGLTITLPTTSGDTVVVWSNDQYTSNTTGTGCVQLKPSTSSTATWYNVNTAYGLPVSFGIIPIACPATTGIENNVLGSNIVLYPNPSNGNFNFAVAMPEATSLSFNVVNTLGQSVFSKTEHNVSNTVITYDLSSLGKGVYFVNIVDGKNNKTVKKIIIE